MKKVILIGGIYGGGKTTTAKRLFDTAQKEGYSPAIVDYDTVIPNGSDRTDALRKEAWEHIFIDSIEAKIADSRYDLVIAPGTFSTRERRNRFIQRLGERDDIELHCLFIMEPMRETIRRVKENRKNDDELVNAERWHGFHRTYIRNFKEENHTDLLLPSDRSSLAPEYISILTKTEENRNHFLSTPNDDFQEKRWIVLTSPLDTSVFLEILRDGIYEPMEVRSRLEGSSLVEREGLPVQRERI